MDWQQWIEEERKKVYFRNLEEFVKSEREVYNIFPPENEVFRAFELSRFQDTKVVILGQDPYHGRLQANGLAFSVNDGLAFPPSLRNIFFELERDLGVEIPISGDLTRWARQGVLLLNDVLTVRENMAGSHQKKGWELFTDSVVERLSVEKEGLVFMLWGNFAQKKGKKIDREKHLVLTSGHPSPMSANRGFWFGNAHFSQANKYLIQRGEEPIVW